jgi:hypothetical protein
MACGAAKSIETLNLSNCTALMPALGSVEGAEDFLYAFSSLRRICVTGVSEKVTNTLRMAKRSLVVECDASPRPWKYFEDM